MFLENTEVQMTPSGLFWLALIFAVTAVWHYFRAGGTLIFLSALLSGICLLAAVVSMFTG
jgi:hypothetical protein